MRNAAGVRERDGFAGEGAMEELAFCVELSDVAEFILPGGDETVDGDGFDFG
jgi:hypothetical protein